jgi:hypothetical protein
LLGLLPRAGRNSPIRFISQDVLEEIVVIACVENRIPIYEVTADSPAPNNLLSMRDATEPGMPLLEMAMSDDSYKHTDAICTGVFLNYEWQHRSGDEPEYLGRPAIKNGTEYVWKGNVYTKAAVAIHHQCFIRIFPYDAICGIMHDQIADGGRTIDPLYRGWFPDVQTFMDGFLVEEKDEDTDLFLLRASRGYSLSEDDRIYWHHGPTTEWTYSEGRMIFVRRHPQPDSRSWDPIFIQDTAFVDVLHFDAEGECSAVERIRLTSDVPDSPRSAHYNFRTDVHFMQWYSLRPDAFRFACFDVCGGMLFRPPFSSMTVEILVVTESGSVRIHQLRFPSAGRILLKNPQLDGFACLFVYNVEDITCVWLRRTPSGDVHESRTTLITKKELICLCIMDDGCELIPLCHYAHLVAITMSMQIVGGFCGLVFTINALTGDIVARNFSRTPARYFGVKHLVAGQ